MAFAANTTQRAWPIARRSTHPTTTTMTSATTLRKPSWRSRRPWGRPLSTTTTKTKAGAADIRPSSPAGAVTYSSSISTDLPLYEPPGVSFDEYLGDRARVFRAMFPDESRSKRLNDEEWRIQMLPLQFLLLTVHPEVVMQLRHRSGSVLELRATEWELRGLDRSYMPSHFDLGVQGSLYVERSTRGGGGRGQSRMKGHLEITISCILPPALMLVQENILRGVAKSVLLRLAEKMKRDVDVGLIADFHKFRREKIVETKARMVNVRGGSI